MFELGLRIIVMNWRNVLGGGGEGEVQWKLVEDIVLLIVSCRTQDGDQRQFFRGCDACNRSEQEHGPAAVMLVEERETSRVFPACSTLVRSQLEYFHQFLALHRRMLSNRR